MCVNGEHLFIYSTPVFLVEKKNITNRWLLFKLTTQKIHFLSSLTQNLCIQMFFDVWIQINICLFGRFRIKMNWFYRGTRVVEYWIIIRKSQLIPCETLICVLLDGLAQCEWTGRLIGFNSKSHCMLLLLLMMMMMTIFRMGKAPAVREIFKSPPIYAHVRNSIKIISIWFRRWNILYFYFHVVVRKAFHSIYVFESIQQW